MINAIADSTTVRSGGSTRLTQRNLLKQFSVSLWISNAKMILGYWALQGGDTNSPS